MVGGELEGTIVLRAVTLEEPETLAEASGRAASPGLDAWLGSSSTVEVRLRVIRPSRIGLLVQRLPEERPRLLQLPALLRLDSGPLMRVCRFHEGPQGRPWEHRYCTRRAVTRDGYCSLHASSWKALYERCAQGGNSACARAEKLMPPTGGFTVYALDYGGQKLKIGMTQSWRLLSRIAEQPHAAAAAVAEYERLTEARSAEKRLGSLRHATEGAGSRLVERLVSAARLVSGSEPSRLASRLAGLLAGLGLRGAYQGYTVLPSERSPAEMAALPILGEARAPMAMLLEDYWAGLLLARLGSDRVLVPKNALLHLAWRGSLRSLG